MANRMSPSLEPHDMRAELWHWLGQTEQSDFWKQVLNLSDGWYTLRSTKLIGATETHPAGIGGTTVTGAVYGSGYQLLPIQIWKKISEKNAALGIRAIGVSVTDSRVWRLGHLIVRDGPHIPELDMRLDDWITQRSDRVEAFLRLVVDGVDPSEITGHTSMTPREMRNQAAWGLALIAAAGAIPNADITSNYGPTNTSQT